MRGWANDGVAALPQVIWSSSAGSPMYWCVLSSASLHRVDCRGFHTTSSTTALRAKVCTPPITPMDVQR